MSSKWQQETSVQPLPCLGCGERDTETQGGLLFSYSLSAENDYGYTIVVAYFHDGWHSQGG